MQFHTAVNTSFTWKGSSGFNLHKCDNTHTIVGTSVASAGWCWPRPRLEPILQLASLPTNWYCERSYATPAWPMLRCCCAAVAAGSTHQCVLAVAAQ